MGALKQDRAFEYSEKPELGGHNPHGGQQKLDPLCGLHKLKPHGSLYKLSPHCGRRRRNTLAFHLMLLPAVIIVFIFSYIPMAGIFIAFQDFKPVLGIFGGKWTGLENFRFLLMLPNTLPVLRNTVYIALMKIAVFLFFPIFISLLLNEVRSKIYKRTIQTIVYFPHFLSWVIMAGVIITLLSPSDGLVASAFKALGREPVYFLASPAAFPYIMVVTDLLKEFGFSTVIYLAALTGIDPSLYEAAMIDGAGRWKQTLHITLPGMMPIVLLMTVLSMSNVLNAGFDQIYNFLTPVVYRTGDILDTFIFRLGMVEAKYGLATAAGLFKSIVSLALIILGYRLADRLAGYRVF